MSLNVSLRLPQFCRNRSYEKDNSILSGKILELQQQLLVEERRYLIPEGDDELEFAYGITYGIERL